MYTKKNYGFWMTFNWSKMAFIYGFIYSLLIALLHYVLSSQYKVDISLPWQPLGVLGISVAFYLGFKNNSSYDRLWDARKSWGRIVNNSRSFGSCINAFVSGEEDVKIKKSIIYRHIAWLTALRFQLRLSRPWEHIVDRRDEYPKTVDTDYFTKLEKEIAPYIAKAEFDSYRSKSNIAAQILNTQAKALQNLRNNNYFEDFRHMELHQLIKSFYDDQGGCERIKNFPFPRQYTSVAYWSTLVFALLIPFGIINIFLESKTNLYWANLPLSSLLIWIFFLMEKIGDYSENPFEGTYNDVPITSIARSIEIDMREMVNDDNIPNAVSADKEGYLM